MVLSFCLILFHVQWQQNRQWTLTVILLQWKSNKYYLFWVCVCSLSYPWSCVLSHNIFAPYLIKSTILEKLLNKICMFWFSVQLLSATFLISMYSCILIVRPCILNVVHVFLYLSMYSYCSSMYSYRCLCIPIVVYVFLFSSMYSYRCLCILIVVYVYLSLSMYSYCCLCILIVCPYILIVVYVFLSMYSYCCLCILIVVYVVYSYCSSMYSYCCLCILNIVYVFLLFVHVFWLLSIYS